MNVAPVDQKDRAQRPTLDEVLREPQAVVTMTGPPEPAVAAALDFDVLFRDHGAFVMRVVRRMGIPDADVEDVAQEVFLVLHRKRADYDPRLPLRPWIFGVAARTASAARRRAHRRYEVLDPAPTTPLVTPAQELALDVTRARSLLDRALDALDDDKRAVFVAFDLEEMAMTDIAALQGCPLQTAYSRLYAARNQVRATVDRILAQGGSHE